ncbi:MAG: malonic semialdehyde reductase [Beijerinckiaceae bacterium]|nr:malonic semialdehyde reductase [Beijerinckiaceae bacterium]
MKLAKRHRVDERCLDIAFRQARTFSAWQPKPVSERTLHELADLLKMGPTSANCSPARFVFITTAAGRERLRPFLDPGNVDKTMSAPVTVIVGYDLDFHERLPQLFPHADAKSWFVGNEQKIADTAFRNGTLQGGYLILAARMLGLDCGPMSGFNQAGVDAEFFADTKIKSNFLVNLGYGSSEKLFPRSPRLSFDAFCQII